VATAGDRPPRPEAAILIWKDVFVAFEGVSTEPVGRVWKGVEGRLLEEGWATLEAKRFDPSCAGALCLALKDGFAATMRVLDRIDEERSGQLMVSPVGVVGLDYEPARELTLALTGFARSGVVLKEPTLAVALSGEHAALGATESLVRFAAEQASSLAGFADIDTLIEMLQRHLAVAAWEAGTVLDGADLSGPVPYAPELPDASLELIPALLAGAGRYEEARRFLGEHYPLGWQESAGPRSRRFVRQLTRWVNNDGKFSLPTTPAIWPPERQQRPEQRTPPASFLEALAESWPVVKARQEAIQAVRAVSQGKTQDELRILLRDELRKREVSMEPEGFEQRIDTLAIEREPLGKARIALRALAALRDLGLPGTTPIRSTLTGENRERLDDRLDPAWMQTPERAAYPILLVGPDRVAVQLDPDARTWLAEALHEAGPDAVQRRFVEVWLAPDSELPASAPRVSVHIGSRRVGYLDADATERLRPALQAAAERDEDAQMKVHLTRLAGTAKYVLALPLPASQDDPPG
jgi:hypothetical protein